MTVLKKIFKFIASMRFAIILLIVVALVCAIGSLVPQGEQFDLYKSAYSERAAAFILAFRLDDVFHSWWFIALTALLCLSVLLCNISRIKALIHATRDAAQPEKAIKAEPNASATVADPKPVFRRMHVYRTVETRADGKPALFGCRNRIGFWGAWVCHVGIVLIVLGYALGQMTLFSATVYGTVGQTKPIENTPYEVTFDGFSADRTETGFVEQYTTALTVRDPETNRSQGGTASVNHPAVLCGMKFYQTSTGSAVRVTISENGEPFESADLCVGEELTISFLPGLSLYLDAYEPDHNGTGKPAYHILFFYQGQHVEIGAEYFAPGGVIDLNPYALTLSDPLDYTLLRVKKDSFAWLVLLGAVLTTAGLFAALYLVPETLWAVQNDDGTWTVFGKSKKLAPLFREQFERAVSGKRGKEERV